MVSNRRTITVSNLKTFRWWAHIHTPARKFAPAQHPADPPVQSSAWTWTGKANIIFLQSMWRRRRNSTHMRASKYDGNQKKRGVRTKSTFSSSTHTPTLTHAPHSAKTNSIHPKVGHVANPRSRFAFIAFAAALFHSGRV